MGEDVGEDAQALIQVGGSGGIDVGQHGRGLALFRHHAAAGQEVMMFARVSLQRLDDGRGDGGEMTRHQTVAGAQRIAE